MTDDTGILQHAIFSVPNTREGYTTDDNARALIVSILLEESLNSQTELEYLDLSRRYLAFLWLAFNTDIGRFRNFFGYDRKWLEDVGSEDSHGRALWSLGQSARPLAGCGIERCGREALRSRGPCNA